MGNELRVNSNTSIGRNYKLEEPGNVGVRPLSAPIHPERPLERRVSQTPHPQIAWRVKELDGFEINSFFDTIRLIDHLNFFDRNNIAHEKMRLLPGLKYIFTRDINKTLNHILYDKGLSASEKLFAGSVYERVTGKKFYLSTFIDELTTMSNESIPEIKTEDFYPVPLFWGDVEIKLKEGIFTNNFSLVREAIAQGADLNKKDEELNWTPLHYAITVGNVSITYLLLQNGANPNISPVKASDLDKWVEGKRKIFDPLNQGADKFLMKDWDSRDFKAEKKFSPFELALNKKHYTILLQLASAGAKFTQEQIDSISDDNTKRSLQNYFDLRLSKVLKSKKSDFAKAIRSQAEAIVTKMNSESLEMQKSVNSDIRRVSRERRKNSNIIEQFHLDMDRNPALITYKNGKILTEGLFQGKYLIDHDFLLHKTSDLKAVHFLEANLHQGRLADAIGTVKGAALLLGTSKTFELNGKTVFYDLNPTYTMDVEEGKNASSYSLTVRAKFHHCLTEGHEKVVENYQQLFTIEQTYTIEDGVAVDFSCALI